MLIIMKEIIENEPVLKPEGRIDSTVSDEFQKKVIDEMKNYSNMTLDFEKVEYISSAGLRGIILGNKTALSKGGSLKVINCNPSVRDVLCSVGLDTLMEIK